jgi:hypothetical protein
VQESNAIVGVYGGLADLEAGIRALRESNFDLHNVSALGLGESGGETVAYYQMPGRIVCGGRMGAFWTHIWGLLFGWAFISIPELGPILVAGPLAMWIIAALDNASLFTGLSAVGAGLYSLGIPHARIMRYEAALKRHMYLVVVHGAAAEVSWARAILKETRHRSPGLPLTGFHRTLSA